MVGFLLAAAVAAQQPQVSASVDRSEAMVGDVITLTIRVEAEGPDPIRVVNPMVAGLETRGTREATQVSIVGGRSHRTFTRALRLAAISPGLATIGPVVVRQGDEVVETSAITITVTAPADGIAAALSPRILSVIDRALPAPSGEEVVVDVRATPATVVLGEQVDLVTLAWFPRDVRMQLRTPPTLSPPEVEGVWSYRRATPTGIVTSRRMGNRWYDLFVSHQVLFPLAAGPVRVGPATVSYVLPLTYSFLSRELQHEVQSDTFSVAALPQPASGRPPAFSGAAGSEITVDFSVTPEQLAPGRAATATVALEGVGNVALWPAPDIKWPIGVRVYPGDVTVDLTPRDGLIAGRKQFAFLLVPDSAGSHRIPAVPYRYFDPTTRRYERAAAPGVQLIASQGTGSVSARPSPPPLLGAGAAQRWSQPLDRMPDWGWVVMLLVGPAFAAALRLRKRVRRHPSPFRTAAPAVDRGELETLDHALRSALARLVPDPAHRDGPGLAAALRAAGLDPSLAAHALRVRDRLQRAVFGPAGVSDREELVAEVNQVLGALEGMTGPALRQRIPVASVLVALLASQAVAQAPSAEQLYAAGAYRGAAEAFLDRARAAPDIAAHWFNVGNAFYQMGEDGRALVAWTRAARLAPRDPSVRRALDLLPADRETERLTNVGRLAAGELAAIAALGWLVGWALIGWRRLVPVAVALLLGTLAVGALAYRAESDRRRPVAVVLQDDVPLRVAPYGPAPASRTLLEASAVVIEGRDGPWFLVRRLSDRGWVLRREVARL